MDKTIHLQSSGSGRRRKVFLLMALSPGYFMVLLDTTVVTVALPAIHEALGGGLEGLQWVVNAYTVVFAGFLLSMGALSDDLGAKRAYIGGLALFLVASAAMAASTSLGELIGFRAILGLGGAALMPASLSLISRAYEDPAERARALGVWAAVTGLAMAAGPVVGGLLVDTLGWRSIFLIQVPFAAISMIMTLVWVQDTRPKRQYGLDVPGQAAAILTIAALSFALMEGGTIGWGAPSIVAAWGIALISAAAFIRLEARSRNPLLPLTLFSSKTVSAGMLAGMMINVGLSGILFIVPLFFQQVRGLSAHMAGWALLPLTVPMAFNPILTGRLVGRIGARIPMSAGFLLAASGTLLLLGIGAGAGYTVPLIGLLLIGFGVSLAIPSLMTAVISAVPKEQTGVASGALNSSRQLGATLGVALQGAMVSGSGTFTAGLHASLIVTCVVLFCGGVLSLLYMGTEPTGTRTAKQGQ